jgi:hypothetical protein
MLFFAVALSPVDLLGCRTRGLLALLLAFASGIGALVTAVLALRGRVKGDAGSGRWMLTALILTIPVVAMIVMAWQQRRRSLCDGPPGPSRFPESCARSSLTIQVSKKTA